MKGFKVRVAAAFAFVAGVTVLACSGGTEEPADSTNSAASSLNLCVGQVANSFHCIDDTRFQLCTGNGTFVVEACGAPGLCATRHPAIKNPCIGAQRATEIDGVPPTPPGQIDDGKGGANAGGNGGAAQNGGNAGNAGNAAGGNTGGGTASGGNTGGGNTGAANNGGGNTGGNGGQCVGGPKFEPAGTKNVGNGHGGQFIGGQCLSAVDCASGCCALPCGICSGPGAQFQAGKQGCGFGG
jgi:hypothetical protein